MHTRQGVKYACPDCTVEGEFLNTFDPGALVRHIAPYYADTVAADVTFGAGGIAGAYVINETAKGEPRVRVWGGVCVGAWGVHGWARGHRGYTRHG